jgi:hypothetical protein
MTFSFSTHRQEPCSSLPQTRLQPDTSLWDASGISHRFLGSRAGGAANGVLHQKRQSRGRNEVAHAQLVQAFPIGSGFANVGNDEPATRFENAHSVHDRDEQGGNEGPFSVEANCLSDRAVSPLKRAFLICQKPRASPTNLNRACSRRVRAGEMRHVETLLSPLVCTRLTCARPAEHVAIQLGDQAPIR